MVKAYLSRSSVPFEEVNLSGNPEGIKRLLALGRRVTPVTTIGDVVVVGFKPNDLRQALASAGLV
jgi:glutaredoxin